MQLCVQELEPCCQVLVYDNLVRESAWALHPQCES